MANYDEESCPKCGGRMWDNRRTKRNPRAPDFRCRDRSCDGAIWADSKSGRKRPEGTDDQPADEEMGDLPGFPAARSQERAPAPVAQSEAQRPTGPQRGSKEARRAFLEEHAKCLNFVLDEYVPLIRTKLGDDSADYTIDVRGIAALTYQLLRGRADA